MDSSKLSSLPTGSLVRVENILRGALFKEMQPKNQGFPYWKTLRDANRGGIASNQADLGGPGMAHADLF